MYRLPTYSRSNVVTDSTVLEQIVEDYNYMYIMCFYLNTNWFEWTAVLVPSSSNENEIIIFMTIDYSDPDRKPTSRFS